ncbi:PiggyBac transposable element-derived protein 4 [Merluccius polli]|uniref:PiggyBac transposable element-derived protein 4 n=1 Tax=Merluccius polli TaxID=89951 RepID=A0AA47NT72_MERPO|nr:PiggyBac transposable element-derived protein 4 [Merluccius polli]
MARRFRKQRKMNVQQALEFLQNMHAVDSDGGSDIEFEMEEDSDASDSELEPEPECDTVPPAETPQAPLCKRARTEPTEQTQRTERARHGTVWEEQSVGAARSAGRLPAHMVLTETAGPTHHAKARIASRLDCFLSLVDTEMLTQIRDCSVAEACRTDAKLDLTVDELMAFIALCYVRGLYGGKSMDMESYWSEIFGLPFFKETMPRNRYRQIMKCLRFDNKDTRAERLLADKFALISDTWNSFVKNSIACYKPGQNITVGEQLFLTKSRCPFTTASKPDKFGIKFWIAADVDTKYMLNALPYLGKDPTRPAGERASETVVMRLIEPFTGKGRNVTMDNFFTSLSLADKLIAKNTSILGTMNKIRQELPPSVKVDTPTELFSTTVMTSGKASLTIYRCKPKKSICILSTMHPTVIIGTEKKKKPDTVTDYNNTKGSVDVLDQMARLYSVKGGTRRWPVAVFYNMLDLAAINAHVLYKTCLDERENRRDFIMGLACELRQNHMKTKAAATAAETAVRVTATLDVPLAPGKTTQC